MQVAVIGNSPTNAGANVAADLALAGRSVRFARWSEAEADFDAIRKAGGIRVEGDAAHLVSGRLGLAQPELSDDPARAVAGADLVVLDLVPAELEARIRTIAPALSPRHIVHVNTCSYWSALRAATLLREQVREGLTLTEIIAPTTTADLKGALLRTKWLRGQLPVAAFPANRSPQALETMRVVYPGLRAAANVLETSYANLNMLVHAAVALINVGWFDRAKEAGEDTDFWMGGSTAHAGILGEAQDQERRRVSEAFGVRWASTAEHLGKTYGGPATSFREAIRGCAFYRSLPKRSPEMWRRWLAADIPMAHVPFAALAALAGTPVPLHDAYITTFSALLGRDFRTEGLTLGQLGLDGMSKEDVAEFVTIGDR